MSHAKDFCCTTRENESFRGEKLIYPAASRNKEPILQVLKKYQIIDSDCNEVQNRLFLEIASGSGQHVAHFAPHFPNVKFQPTEFDENLLGSITYYARNCPTKNILDPMILNVCNKFSFYGYLENSIDYIYNANMMHISPYACTIGLFENAGKYLKSGSFLITYGPYSKDGIITPESNVRFDASLRSQNPSWGLRDLSELIKLAQENNLTLIESIEMPSNNFTLIWKKK